MLKGFTALAQKLRKEVATLWRCYVRHIFACVDDSLNFHIQSFDCGADLSLAHVVLV